MQYSDFQNLASSEKITLAILNASKRLMGWELHSGSIYKITGFDYAVIHALEDSGTAYTAAASLGAVTASKYFLDQANETLYVRASDSSNPNSRFLVVTIKLFFANVPIVLPFDLDAGSDVFFEPLLLSTSEFGVEIDTIAQTSEAIEGSGSMTLLNDHDFWPENFDRLSFENQRCMLYSYHRALAPTDARLIFKGRVEKKSYSKDAISFQLKDQFAELRTPIALETIGSLNERTGDDLENAKQRMVFGRVFGHVPTNLDRVLDGYPLTGTVSIGFGELVVEGTGTAFMAELSPNDRIVLGGEDYTIATITDADTLTLTQEFEGDSGITNETAYVIPAESKRFINRRFQVAGHALREPTTSVLDGSTVQALFVDDTTDIFPGDTIYVGVLGSGEIATVDSVNGSNYLRLSTSLATIPSEGTLITRPAIQNVRIDNVMLEYYSDYTFDADTAELELRTTAEENAGPIYQLSSSMTFTNGSRVVTGTGFQGIINASYMVGIEGNADFFEVLSVDSDTQLTLRIVSSFTGTDTGRYKPLVYDEGLTVLTLDLLGRTDDGTPSGALIKTAPAISKMLLEDAGLVAEIDETSFDDAEEIAYQHIGIAIPSDFGSTVSPTYRDILNKVNKSVFGALVQDIDFKFSYQVLRPNKSSTALKFTEADLLQFTLTATAENAVKMCTIQYRSREHDYIAKERVTSEIDRVSDNATYVAKTERTRVISTVLCEERDADIMAKRWSFLLDNSSSRLNFTTKLQGITLQVGDIIEIEHRKFFERFGGSGKRKILLVEAVKRSGSQVKIEATDLSNAFNRVAAINTLSNDWSTATEDEHLYGGFITDQYGLIDNDPENFGTNLIW